MEYYFPMSYKCFLIHKTWGIDSIFIISTNDKDLRSEFSRVPVHLTQTPDLIHTSLIRDTLAYERKCYCQSNKYGNVYNVGVRTYTYVSTE